jgi:hypothetical protein
LGTVGPKLLSDMQAMIDAGSWPQGHFVLGSRLPNVAPFIDSRFG